MGVMEIYGSYYKAPGRARASSARLYVFVIMYAFYFLRCYRVGVHAVFFHV